MKYLESILFLPNFDKFCNGATQFQFIQPEVNFMVKQRLNKYYKTWATRYQCVNYLLHALVRSPD